MTLHQICDSCDQRQRPCAGACICAANGQDIHDNIDDLACPRDKFTAEGIELEKSRPKNATGGGDKYWPMWAGLHRRPLFAADLANERTWLDTWSRQVPCGKCQRKWAALLKDFPPDFTSRRAYFLWTVEAHNKVNDLLGKPRITAARAARIHGCMSLLSAEELAADTAPVHLHIVNRWSLGDIVVSTAPIRDLMLAYPGEFTVSVECSAPEVFDGLQVEPLGNRKPDLVWHFPVDYRNEPEGINFCQFAVRRLGEFSNREIPCTAVRPWLLAA